MKFLGARKQGAASQYAVIAIGLFVAFFVVIIGIGLLVSLINRRTGAVANATGVGYAGQQFQEVKKVTITMTQYSPNMPSIGNTCDSEAGGGSGTSTGGTFKVVNGRLSWTKGDLVENYVFAQPQTYNIIPKDQLNNMAVVFPGFNNNTPIYIRDVYGPGVHTNENYLDLFVPCSEFTNSSKKVDIIIVDLTKPLGNSSIGPNINGTYYPPLGGQKATHTNAKPHGKPGHGVFMASPFGDGFKDIDNGAIDFSAPGGTPVYAAFDGTIVRSLEKYHPDSNAYQSGAGILWLKSSDGNNGAIYAHIAFAPGIGTNSTVKKGQQIGTVAPECGSGQCVSFGPHLHFQIYPNKQGQTKDQILALFPNSG